MTVNRSSTSLVRYLGATVKAGKSGGSKLTNVASDVQGTVTRVDPATRLLTQTGLKQDSIKIADYQAALGYLGQRGIDPLVAKTMAAAFVDVAKSQGINVMSLLETTDPAKIAVIDAQVFNRMNQIRDLTSQLSTSSNIDNTASVPARRIQA